MQYAYTGVVTNAVSVGGCQIPGKRGMRRNVTRQWMLQHSKARLTEFLERASVPSVLQMAYAFAQLPVF